MLSSSGCILASNTSKVSLFWCSKKVLLNHWGVWILFLLYFHLQFKHYTLVSESRSVMCDSLQPHGLYSHGILQARILEWVAFPFSRGSSQLRGWTQVSCIAGGFFTSWATREAPRILKWVAYPFSWGFSWPRNRTRVSCIVGGFFTSWATRKAQAEGRTA